MCGIMGTFGLWGLTDKEKKITRELFYLDAIRGFDSSGCVMYNHMRSDDFFTAKEVGLPNELEAIEDYRTYFRSGFNAFIGHNRKATTGTISRDNAHPFHKGNIIGVHNGTLSEIDISRLLPYSDRDCAKDITDTELLYEVMAQHGVQHVWSNIWGAATLVWMDLTDGSMNFASNGKRPFHYWVNPSGRMFFASEAWMLGVAVNRTTKVDVLPVELPKDIHFKVTRFPGKQGPDGLHIERTSLVPLEKPIVDYTTYYRGTSKYYPYQNRIGRDIDGRDITLPTTDSNDTVEKHTISRIDSQGDRIIVREDGTEVHENQFANMKCNWCQDQLYYEKSMLYAADLQLCEECDAIAQHCDLS